MLCFVKINSTLFNLLLLFYSLWLKTKFSCPSLQLLTFEASTLNRSTGSGWWGTLISGTSTFGSSGCQLVQIQMGVNIRHRAYTVGSEHKKKHSLHKREWTHKTQSLHRQEWTHKTQSLHRREWTHKTQSLHRGEWTHKTQSLHKWAWTQETENEHTRHRAYTDGSEYTRHTVNAFEGDSWAVGEANLLATNGWLTLSRRVLSSCWQLTTLSLFFSTLMMRATALISSLHPEIEYQHNNVNVPRKWKPA